MAKLHVFDHPLIQHKLTLIRDKQTGSKDFRDLVDEVSTLMAYEVTRDLPLMEVEIQTPVCPRENKSNNRQKARCGAGAACRLGDG